MTTPTNTAAAISSCTDRQFTKKPVTIQAIQWTGRNLREVITFTDGPPDTRSHHAGMAWEAYADLVARDGLMIYTLEDGPDRRAKHFADIGDWIIRGVKGEYYPCKPDIFEATYSRTAIAAELPRQSAEIETMRTGYEAARLEIESLRGRGVEPAGEYPALPGRTIDELTESQRESAIAAYRAAHEQDPDFGFAPDRAWVEGAAYVDADRAMRVAQPATADDRAAFKAYLEDCDECAIVPDIAGAFHAGWTSRVRAAQPAGTQRPGDERAAFEQWSEVTNQGYDLARNVSGKLQTFESTETEHAWRGFFHGLRASHGQAPINLNCKSEQKRLATLWGFVPAQAAPAYKDSTPELHIGDSAFESWYSSYSPAHKSDKQRARDAYAAGMGDPLVTAAPAAVAGCTRSHPHENMDSACRAKAAIAEMRNKAARGAEATAHDLDRFVVMLTAAPTTQPSPQQEAQEPAAVVVPCHTPSGKRVALYSAKQDLPIGTQLYTAPQPSPAARGDALDTMRLDWLDADESRCVFHLGKSWYTRPSYGLPYRKRASLREAIDAARKEMP